MNASLKMVRVTMLALATGMNAVLWTGLAVADTYALDPMYSSCVLRVAYLSGFARGEFTRFFGTMEADASGNAKKLVVDLEATSLSFNGEELSATFKGPRMFDSKKFPVARFVSREITSDKMVGELTLRGITKEIGFEYAFHGISKDQWGRSKAAWSLKGVIPASDFGMEGSASVSSASGAQNIEVVFELEGVLQ